MARAGLRRLLPRAPQLLLDALDSAQGPLLPPIRSEIFGPQRFALHGRSLGQTHRAAPSRSRASTFVPRLRSNIRALRQAHRYIGMHAASGYDVSPAGEWLLDNFHLIAAQLKEISEGLPRDYFRALPVLLEPPLAGLPRIYGVAWAFVAHTDGAFDETLLGGFLCAYQETRELHLSELWALPTTLRVVLIENLRRLAERVATNKAAREVANLCCDHIESWPVFELEQLLELLQRRGAGRMFLAQMALRLGHSSDSAQEHLSQEQQDWLKGALPDLAAAQAQHSADQTADNLSVGNAVTALRAIGDADWPEIVERASPLMQRMLGSALFAAEHAGTRDQTLHQIEALASHGGLGELQVADALLELMQTAPQHEPGARLASYWLRGAGRGRLQGALGTHGRTRIRWRAMARQIRLPLYLATLLLGSLGLVAWLLLRRDGGADDALWASLAAAALMMFPASDAVVALVNRLISESLVPRHLPRLALAQGIPAEHRVMVVMPTMLVSAAAIDKLVHRLELHHLANPEHHAQFALLTDWLDADQARVASDQALLDHAAQRVRELNQRHPQLPTDGAEPVQAPRFILLHRERSFSPSEQRWIGWERKRGKLELLLAALALDDAAAFCDMGELSRMASATRYLVTLDSDTWLPPGRLRDLVSVAAHPQNQPQLDASGRTVLRGYAILQPHVATPLPAPREFTRFHWLFAGQCGIDTYSAASSEIYQDLFEEGSFSGKGLLNVRAVHSVLSARLPEGQVLSHDLLEGSLARCAAVTDISVLEDAPFHADVAASRVHRWTRGDWQLLPFLCSRRYPLRAINRWKMFDNLRRSLVAPMSLALLLLVLHGQVMPPLAALALVLAGFCAGPVLGALAGFSSQLEDLARLRFHRQAALDLWRALCGGLWHLAQLVKHAMQAIDAITRTLHRMGRSRRHLLQWTTAAQAQAQAVTGLPALARQHLAVSLLSLTMLAGLLLAGTPHPELAWALCLLWAGSPLWTWWVSRPRLARSDAALPAAERAYLEGVARDSWRLFEQCVGPEDHHLPPDNLQVSPQATLAHRTSPTNIGLYLLSVACARTFGWIGTPDLIARMEATLATLRGLQRCRGHFLNWYDTQTCAALMPMYVSTVDSGNLCGHLLATAQACLELADATPGADNATGASGRLRRLAREFEKLAWEPDFRFLYHSKRHLLHIGWRVAEQQLDAGFYDLLASESRLTSLLAIAKGDVPARNWSSLGRPFFAVGACAGLRSWSGSMFEYLMPSLVLEEPIGSVLRDACRSALCEQIAFARAHGLPWGNSESAYAGRDHTLAYQYAPQGVPRLALRRTPPDEMVVAPYACALAAQLDPRAACSNFKHLEALGARGRYGFIEALDFSLARRGGDERFTPVLTFMAHHQGMSIVALANVLHDGVARRWGMGNAHIEAVVSLLHERPPREVSVLYAPPAGPPPRALLQRPPGLLRLLTPGATAVEPTHLLSNGRYQVSLRANGAGWSRLGSRGITRWRDDALRDAHGSFLYLRWQDPQEPAGPAPLVSLTQHPAPDPAARYQCVFHADRVCFEASWPGLSARVTVWVSPEDDIEFREVELLNLGEHPLEVELSSAFEVVLTEADADEAHPAFTNLFVRARWQTEHQALVFERRPRLATERGLLAAHFLTDVRAQVLDLRVQTDRGRWLGRNRGADRPLAVLDALPPAGDDAAALLDCGLDPVCVLATRLRIAPQASASITFATAASADAATLQAVIDKYRQPSHVQRASLMSATLTGIRLRALRINPESFAAIQTLTTALALSLTRPRARAPRSAQAAPIACDRRLLWRFGISGERPFILLTLGATQDLGLLRSLVQALGLWSWGGIACDLVTLNTEPASYQMALRQEIAALRARHLADTGAVPGATGTGLHGLHIDELSAAELATLKGLARVRLHADGRPLAHHVNEWSALHELALEQRLAAAGPALLLAPGRRTEPDAPSGEFAQPSGEFRFAVSGRVRPARPWINVLSNPAFGCQISESGAGYSWAVNSRLNQLTAWSNDPLSDPPGEWFLLQDRKSLQAWSVAPSAWGDESLDYQVAHGQGYTSIGHRRGDLMVLASWCVDPQTSVKQVRLQLANVGRRTLQLRVIGMAEWMMGANRRDRGTVFTSMHSQRLGAAQAGASQAATRAGRSLRALLCTQREAAAGFGGGTAFLALNLAPADADDDGDEAAADWTCDRRECFDPRGRLVLPEHFGQRSGAGLDPCAALSTLLELASGEKAERVFLLGYADTPQAARQLAEQAAATDPTQRLDQVREAWDRLLGATTVTTPDPLFDAMVNRWLLYQTLSCRLWAKAGFYQAGGATGYRDQLQDAMALAWAEPSTLRAQIVLCASRQFPQGDVQHWWHTPGGAGVRTHISDDLLWLAHACLHYLHASGDSALLDQQVHFIEGSPIPPGADDIYEVPQASLASASVYEHAALALERSLAVGAHGLPLMGDGDWNDGMNRVGHGGRGESVWLAWFLCDLVRGFAPLARARGDLARALRWEASAARWKAALQGSAWDGGWYKRAYFDDGRPLGSHDNPEARIDLVAQVWAVLSGAAPVERQRLAMAAVQSHLVDPHVGLIRLLEPPLARAEPNAGYIQAYPPGVRENGGQYSHAAVWAVMAQARLSAGEPGGEGADLAYRYFTYLSPAHRARDPVFGPIYGIEPYVMAGDVCSQPPYAGRGGWSWYTGSAGLMHRAAIESIFGLQLGAGQLRFVPCLPSHWRQAELTLRRDGRTMRFILRRPDVTGVDQATAQGGPPVDARPLAPGELLNWTDLPPDSCFVIALADRSDPVRQRTDASGSGT